MALLLQCLRDVRILSGDLDLLPPSPGARALDVRRLARTRDDKTGAHAWPGTDPESMALAHRVGRLPIFAGRP